MDVRHHAEARAFAHLAAEAPLPDQSNADFDETASLHEGLIASATVGSRFSLADGRPTTGPSDSLPVLAAWRRLRP